MTPTTCPLAITPLSGRPSTSAAFNSIGVFAAMTVCVQLRSIDRRIARPSRHIAPTPRPVMARKRSAFATARGNARSTTATGLEPIDQRRVQHAVRHAVDLRRHDRAGDAAAEVHLLDRRRHGRVGGEEEAGSHRDAVGAVGERGHEPAAVEEPAGGDHRHAPGDRVDHLGQQDRRRDRPGVPAALTALDEHGVDAPLQHLLGMPPARRSTGSRARRRRGVA